MEGETLTLDQGEVLEHARILDNARDFASRVDRLCELNVIEQVVHVARTTIVQAAWDRGQPLTLHGLVYGLADGLLHDVGMEAESMSALQSDYARAIDTMTRRPT